MLASLLRRAPRLSSPALPAAAAKRFITLPPIRHEKRDFLYTLDPNHGDPDFTLVEGALCFLKISNPVEYLISPASHPSKFS
jgi:hypothetical protein